MQVLPVAVPHDEGHAYPRIDQGYGKRRADAILIGRRLDVWLEAIASMSRAIFAPSSR